MRRVSDECEVDHGWRAEPVGYIDEVGPLISAVQPCLSPHALSLSVDVGVSSATEKKAPKGVAEGLVCVRKRRWVQDLAGYG